MADKYLKTSEIKALAQETAASLTLSKDNWTSFLRLSARMYKYPYADRLLIYAQRPNATACADFDIWNKQMKRYIRKGSKGIALIDTEKEPFALKYVFDISDTVKTEYSKTPNIWKYSDEHEAVVASAVEKAFGILEETRIEDSFRTIAKNLASEYWDNNKRDFFDILDGTFFEDYDEYGIEKEVKNTACMSTLYAVLYRCGFNADEYFVDEDFSGIYNFNTPDSAGFLAQAVSETSEEILRLIETTVKKYERERSNNHEQTYLQSSRRLSDPEHIDVSTGKETFGQIRSNEEQLSERTSSDIVEQDASEQYPLQTPYADRGNGKRTLGTDDEPIVEIGGSNTGAERERSDEMGPTAKHSESTSGRNDNGGTDLQLNFFSLLESEGQLSLFPTEDEQIQIINEEAKSGFNTLFASSVSQNVKDDFLRLGTNDFRSRMFICAEFMHGKTDSENAEFLCKLYGKDGSGYFSEGREFSAFYDENGIRISSGNSAKTKYAAEISWQEAAERIRHLLENGTYAAEKELTDAYEFAAQDLSGNILLAYSDWNIENKEELLPVLSDIYNSFSGYPERTDALKQILLSRDDKLNAVINEIKTVSYEYEHDSNIVRFSTHEPIMFLEKISGFCSEPLSFIASKDFKGEPKRFISQDEIDDLIKENESNHDFRLSVYSFFVTNRDMTDRINHLKKYYGEYSGSCTVKDNIEHNSKGVSLSHGKITDPFAQVQLPWTSVAKRIDRLIGNDDFLSQKDKNLMPDYERSILAKSIVSFFHGLPEEKRPYSGNDITDIREYTNKIKNMLSDYEAANELYLEYIIPVWNETESSDKHYEARKNGYENMTAYINGVFSVFGKKETLEPLREKNTGNYVLSMIDEYFDIKRNNFDSLVLYQVGDFFELFGEDAVVAARELNLMTTTRALPDNTATMMCGFPRHIFEEYTNILRVGHDLTVSAIPDNKTEREVFNFSRFEQKEDKEPFPFSVGDKVYLENGDMYIVERIGKNDIALSDPSLLYPVSRVENKENLLRLVAEYPQKVEEPTDFAKEPENFKITDFDLGAGGAKAKFRMNMNAITLLKELERDGRQANAEEQEILSRYVGWGGIPDAFDDTKENWANEYKELANALEPDEYRAAKASVLNAHYTSPTVIKAIYEAVGNMGFTNGNILEPSMGTGNFFGMLPDEMSSSKLYGVELDNITGRIAKQLYPKANITIAGFETTNRRDFYDLAIGNVPFGSYKVNDKAYNKLGFSIHNYFFAKALDQVRPGGVIAFVTSRHTMDSKSEEVRKYLAQRAELLGAIRLPNNAFKSNAATEVVSDIIFLQKREQPIDIQPDWVHLATNDKGYSINSYFVDNPDMILGEQTSESTMYSSDSFTVKAKEGADLGELLHEAVGKIKGTYISAEIDETDDLSYDSSSTIPADPDVKNFSFTVIDGDIYYRQNSIMSKFDVNNTAKERIKGMVELRNCVRDLIDLQTDEETSEIDIKEKQAELNRLYDSFSGKYGLINDKPNKNAFSQDSSYYLLCSLEILDDDNKLKRKADIFTKRTIKSQKKVTHVDTSVEALAVSIGEKAEVDMSFMGELTGKSEDEIYNDLKGVIFINPLYNDGHSGENKYLNADEYLSGNVREKLRLASEKAAEDPETFSVNVEFLTKAQPKDLTASEIEVRLGATWIDKSIVQDFMYDLLKTPPIYRHFIKLNFSEYTAEWWISDKTHISSSDVNANITYGTSRKNAYEILEDSLNLRDVRVYDTVEENGKEKRVLNSKETTIAQQKQQLIKDAFKDWIFRDPERRKILVEKYNELFNSTKPREYDGSHIVFEGMNPEIKLREHQLNAVAHILYGGNTLLAHEVGAGKTFEMVAAAMESKRLGLCQKPLFVVPNHLTEQWASEFLRLYPSANILVTTKKDFEKQNRKKFCAKIATGDYDAIIIGHSQFEKIPVSLERQEELIRRQIEDITENISLMKYDRGEKFTVKQLEKTKRGLETKLEKLQAAERKDDVINFEQLGVDRLYVDEAHNYKNLFLYTKMRNVAGLSTSEAQKSSDMFMKVRYLDEITGGKGVVFATGTPVSNSMTELYTMMRYLQYDTLCKKNLSHFDAWASNFGETTTAIELAPEGTGYRARTRFAKFFNLPELMNMFREAADIKTADTLNLPRPEVEYHNIVAQPTETQQELVKQLSERAAAVHARSVDPSEDNMLKITSDGRKLGLDQRTINPDFADEDNTKVNLCVENIARIYEEGNGEKLTQLVFCDISTPVSKQFADDVSGDKPFSVYDDIKEKLISRGIPENEIAFIHSANTEEKKKDLFSKVRSGKVRVLMGSTAKMGAGTNVQDRLIALHDLDAPWRPGDLEQRSGRIIRQGNRNNKVHIYRYVTNATFDAYLWQTLEQKQKFIGQIMTSNSPVRSCEDVDETTLSFAEIKALCAGDERIKEKMDLDVEVVKLKLMKSSHQNQQYRLEDDLCVNLPKQEALFKSYIEGFTADLETAKQNEHPENGFIGMTVHGDFLTDKEKAGAALIDAMKEAKIFCDIPIGQYRGFDMSLSVEDFGKKHILTLKRKMSHKIELGKDAKGNLIRIENALNSIEKKIEDVQTRLSIVYEQMENAKRELGKPFPQEEELRQKSARLTELNIALNMDEPQCVSESAVVKCEQPKIKDKLNAFPKPTLPKPDTKLKEDNIL